MQMEIHTVSIINCPIIYYHTSKYIFTANQLLIGVHMDVFSSTNDEEKNSDDVGSGFVHVDLVEHSKTRMENDY